jgi:hypothetical protein
MPIHRRTSKQLANNLSSPERYLLLLQARRKRYGQPPTSTETRRRSKIEQHLADLPPAAGKPLSLIGVKGTPLP